MLRACVALVGLASCGLAPGSRAAPAAQTLPADVVVENAVVYTVDADHPWAEAIAIRGGRIEYVGNAEGLAAHVGSATRRIDAGGRLVLPGLHDAHIHPLEAGSPVAGTCLLPSDRPPESYIDHLRECAPRQLGTDWVLGWGYSVDRLLESERSPVDILDEAIPNRPAAMLSETSHSVWANSAALEAAGIDRTTPHPVGGFIMKDDDGEPSGVLLDNAGDLLLEIALAPNPQIDQLNYEGLLWSLRRLRRNGITSIADARVYRTRNHMEIWRRAETEGTLAVRAVLGLWAYPQFDDDAQIAELVSRFDDDPARLVRVTQVKLYSDGLVQNTTAALLKPYRMDLGVAEGHGLNYFDRDRLRRYVTELERAGFGVHVHAIGDRGVREALDAFEAARAANGPGLDRRHQVTHLEYVHPNDVRRFAELDVFPNFQTSSEFVEPAHRFDTAPYLGRGRIRREFLPLRSIYETGASVVLSSDWDVGDLSAFAGMQRALTRGKQSLPNVEAAVRAYTLNPARLLRQEDRTGSLEIGKLADLVIVDRNIFEVQRRRIGSTQVLLTMLGGEIVYSSGPFAGQ